MQVAAIYSFNNGSEVVAENYPDHLAEIKDVIGSVDAETHRTKESAEKTMKGKMLYSPSSLNTAFKQTFKYWEWKSHRISFTYPNAHYVHGYSAKHRPRNGFREMDFVKEKLGVEIQFGKYAFMVYDVCVKMKIFQNHDIIHNGIEIVPVKAFADQMSSGVSFFEQFVWDLESRGTTNTDVPVMVIGIDA